MNLIFLIFAAYVHAVEFGSTGITKSTPLAGWEVEFHNKKENGEPNKWGVWVKSQDMSGGITDTAEPDVDYYIGGTRASEILCGWHYGQPLAKIKTPADQEVAEGEAHCQLEFTTKAVAIKNPKQFQCSLVDVYRMSVNTGYLAKKTTLHKMLESAKTPVEGLENNDSPVDPKCPGVDWEWTATGKNKCFDKIENFNIPVTEGNVLEGKSGQEYAKIPKAGKSSSNGAECMESCSDLPDCKFVSQQNNKCFLMNSDAGKVAKEGTYNIFKKVACTKEHHKQRSLAVKANSFVVQLNLGLPIRAWDPVETEFRKKYGLRDLDPVEEERGGNPIPYLSTDEFQNVRIKLKKITDRTVRGLCSMWKEMYITYIEKSTCVDLNTYNEKASTPCRKDQLVILPKYILSDAHKRHAAFQDAVAKYKEVFNPREKELTVLFGGDNHDLLGDGCQQHYPWFKCIAYTFRGPGASHAPFWWDGGDGGVKELYIVAEVRKGSAPIQHGMYAEFTKKTNFFSKLDLVVKDIQGIHTSHPLQTCNDKKCPEHFLPKADVADKYCVGSWKVADSTTPWECDFSLNDAGTKWLRQTDGKTCCEMDKQTCGRATCPKHFKRKDNALEKICETWACDFTLKDDGINFKHGDGTKCCEMVRQTCGQAKCPVNFKRKANVDDKLCKTFACDFTLTDSKKAFKHADGTGCCEMDKMPCKKATCPSGFRHKQANLEKFCATWECVIELNTAGTALKSGDSTLCCEKESHAAFSQEVASPQKGSVNLNDILIMSLAAIFTLSAVVLIRNIYSNYESKEQLSALLDHAQEI